jgi:GTP-binding protein EngB required for normal cell division
VTTLSPRGLPGLQAGSTPTSGLNANHARRIASTIAYVEELLREIERLTSVERTDFTRERQDLSDTEARLLRALVASARSRMLAMLDHVGVPRPTATLSARWSISTAFRFIDIALSELTPATLRGYGTIDAASAAEVETVAAELRALVDRGRELLAPAEGEQLRARLASVPGMIGEILRRAELIATEHGLLEVRALIAAAAERAEATTIDIGIFGRVSSGKSSLINALAGSPLLPVGATPVTAVPLRVVHGQDEIWVLHVDGREEIVAPSRLPEFATEAGNRDNHKRVRAVVISTPRIPEGLALLDTPGVGSLSQSGPAQAFAVLPRCDLGLVLVPAGTPIGRDEIALVAGLRHAGISVEVLLSKSDLVAPDERASAIEYLTRELSRIAESTDLTIRPVSVAPAELRLLEQWRAEVLVPMIAARRRVVADALARRVRALLAAMAVALGDDGDSHRGSLEIARARLASEHEIDAATDALYAAARGALETAARAVAQAWHDGIDARAAARDAISAPPARALARARAAADQLLAADTAGTAGADGDATEAGHRLPPLFDPPFLDTLPVAPHAGAFDRLFAASTARRQLAAVSRAVDDTYGTYANRVRAWALERLDENVERARALAAGGTAGAASALPAELRELAVLVERAFGDVQSSVGLMKQITESITNDRHA